MARFASLPSLAVLMFPVVALLSGGCQSILGLDKYSREEDGLGGEGGAPSSGGGKASGGSPASGGRQGSTGGESGGCDGPDDCDDKNPCTADSCDGSECVHATIEAGESCDGGVCNGAKGAEKCVACVDDQPDREVDAGCSDGTPQCRTEGTPECVGCSKHADCDDDNDCTTDACRADGTCRHTGRAVGVDCDNGEPGLCDGTTSKDACVACIDDKTATATDLGCSAETPICSGGRCLACQDSGDTTDLGCTDGAPNCDERAGLCASACSSVECDTDGCTVIPDDSKCPASGACTGRCDATLGCVARVQKTVSVLEDNSFELNTTPWAAAQSIDGGDYEELDINEVLIDVGSEAHDGIWVAKLPSGAGLDYDLYQRFALPEATIKLTFSGYYKSEFVEGSTVDVGDYLSGSLYNYETDKFDPDFLTTKTGEDYSVAAIAPTWTRFEYELTDLSDLPVAESPEINFIGRTNASDPTLIYWLDSVDVVATYCE